MFDYSAFEISDAPISTDLRLAWFEKLGEISTEAFDREITVILVGYLP